MLGALIEKELKLALRARRVRLAAAWMTALCGLAALSGGVEHAGRRAAYLELTAYGARAFGRQPAAHPHAIAHSGYVVARPPAPLGFLDGGAEAAFGRYVRLDAHAVRPLEGARTVELTRGPGGGRFDLGVLLGVFAPLVVLLLGYDLVAGERARGTLLLLTTLGLEKRAFVLSKLIGLASRVALALALPALLAVALAVAFAGGAAPARLLAWLSVHALHLGVWIVWVLSLSALVGTRERALLIGLGSWAALALFFPPLAGGLAEGLRPPRPAGEALLAAEGWARSAHQADEELRARAIRDIQRRHPTWAGTGDPPEVLDAVMLRLADQALARRGAQALDALEAESARAERWATWILAASPSGLAALASSAVAGSDFAHVTRAMRHLERYRVELMAWLNTWWAERGRGGFDAWETERAFDDFASAPLLSPDVPSLRFALTRAARPAMLLAVHALIGAVAFAIVARARLMGVTRG